MHAGRRLLEAVAGSSRGGGGSLPPPKAPATTPQPGASSSGSPASGSSSSHELPGGAPVEVSFKIINGDEVTSADFNFMTALFMDGRFFCGGVLISSDTVLTGAGGTGAWGHGGMAHRYPQDPGAHWG